MQRGIVLLAVGDEVYGKFAFNLMQTIRHHSPNIHIQAIYEPKTFQTRPHILDLADITTEVNKEDINDNNGLFFPAKAKLTWYKYSRFQRTMFLDVDTIMIKDITPLFEQCEGKGYLIQQKEFNLAQGDDEMANMLWATRSVVWEHFKLPLRAKFPSSNSSWQYVEKMGEIVLEKALSELLNNQLPINKHRFYWGKGKHQPDELYLNAAIAQLGKDTRLKECQEPIYFRPGTEYGTPTILSHIQDKYYAIGTYGQLNNNHGSVYEMYDLHLHNIASKGEYFKVHHLMKSKLASTK